MAACYTTAMALVLYVGSPRYSSWSLRPFLALAHAEIPFELRTIALDRPSTRSEIGAVNPAGKVPVLHVDGTAIWDSLAICEYAAELAPGRLWPADPLQRARARSLAAEMHSGFAALRQAMPMDIMADKAGVGHTPEALADAARVQAVWREALAASGGPFLFGAFSIADAMYAPVTTRFTTYGVEVAPDLRAYVAAIAAHPAMARWREAARADG